MQVEKGGENSGEGDERRSQGGDGGDGGKADWTTSTETHKGN